MSRYLSTYIYTINILPIISSCYALHDPSKNQFTHGIKLAELNIGHGADDGREGGREGREKRKKERKKEKKQSD